MHRKNLETHAAGFPPAEFAANDEVVELTEDSTTLDLLFQFIYPRRPPDLNTIDFEVLYSLAEAAEKYELHFAMDLCNRRLK